jgi:hypothetical protein
VQECKSGLNHVVPRFRLSHHSNTETEKNVGRVPKCLRHILEIPGWKVPTEVARSFQGEFLDRTLKHDTISSLEAPHYSPRRPPPPTQTNGAEDSEILGFIKRREQVCDVFYRAAYGKQSHPRFQPSNRIKSITWNKKQE